MTVQVNEDVVDPASGERSLRTSVDISKDQVDAQFSQDADYQCECHAWNNVPRLKPLLTRSRKATIHVACELTAISTVRRRFAASVGVGSTDVLIIRTICF